MPNDTIEPQSVAPENLSEVPDRGISENSDTVYCDRCSGPMFRMRAVYWCANCGYKTDCCGH